MAITEPTNDPTKRNDQLDINPKETNQTNSLSKDDLYNSSKSLFGDSMPDKEQFFSDMKNEKYANNIFNTLKEHDKIDKNLSFDDFNRDTNLTNQVEVKNDPTQQEEDDAEIGSFTWYSKINQNINDNLSEKSKKVSDSLKNNIKVKVEKDVEDISEKYQKKMDDMVKSGEINDENYILYQRRFGKQMSEDVDKKFSELRKEANKEHEEIIKKYYSNQKKPKKIDNDILNKEVEKIFNNPKFKNSDINKQKAAVDDTWNIFKNKLERKGLSDDEIKPYKEDYYYQIYNKIRDNQKRNMDFKVISADQDILMPEGEDRLSPSDKEKVKMENISPFMLKMRLKEMKDEAEKQISELEPTLSQEEKEKLPLKGKFYMNPLGLPDNIADNYDRYIALNKIVKATEDGLNMPEETQGFWNDLWGAMKDQNFYEYIPYVANLTKMAHTLDLGSIKRKALKDYNSLTPDEKDYLEASAVSNTLESSIPKSRGYQVGESIAQSIPFMGEIASTMGTMTGIRKAVSKAFMTKAEAIAGKKIGLSELGGLEANSALARSVNTFSFIAGSLAQTTANPQMYMNNIMERLDPKLAYMYSDDYSQHVALVDGNTEKTWDAIWKGYGQAWSDVFSESLGGPMMVGLGKIGHLATKAPGLKWMANESKDLFKRTMLYSWATKEGIDILNRTALASRIMSSRLDWQGVVPETLEELANNRITDFITGDNQKKGQSRIGELVDFDLENVKTTALTTGIMSLGLGALGGAIKTTFNSDMVKLKRPNGQSISIPKEDFLKIDKELSKLLEKNIKDFKFEDLSKAIDGLKLDKKRKDNLKVFFSGEASKKIKQELRNKVYDLKKPTEISKESEKKLTDAGFDKKEIEDMRLVDDEDINVIAKHPKLYVFGLLDIDDETGKHLPPTLAGLKDKRNYLESQRKDALITLNESENLPKTEKVKVKNQITQIDNLLGSIDSSIETIRKDRIDTAPSKTTIPTTTQKEKVDTPKEEKNTKFSISVDSDSNVVSIGNNKFNVVKENRNKKGEIKSLEVEDQSNGTMVKVSDPEMLNDYEIGKAKEELSNHQNRDPEKTDRKVNSILNKKISKNDQLAVKAIGSFDYDEKTTEIATHHHVLNKFGAKFGQKDIKKALKVLNAEMHRISSIAKKFNSKYAQNIADNLKQRIGNINTYYNKEYNEKSNNQQSEGSTEPTGTTNKSGKKGTVFSKRTKVVGNKQKGSTTNNKGDKLSDTEQQVNSKEKEAKKADIENRKQKELNENFNKQQLGYYKDSGYASESDPVASRQPYFNFSEETVKEKAKLFNKINAKYDEELAKLESTEPTEKKTEENPIPVGLTTAKKKVQEIVSKFKKGMIIYSSPGSGKTFLVNKSRENGVNKFVDADEILKDVLKTNNITFTDQNFGLVAYKHPELKDKFINAIKDLAYSQNKIVLTGNNWGREVADEAILQTDPKKMAESMAKNDRTNNSKITVDKAKQIIAREAKETVNMPINELPSNKYLSDVIMPDKTEGKPLRGLAKTKDALQRLAETVSLDPIDRQDITGEESPGLKQYVQTVFDAVSGLLEYGYDSAEHLIKVLKKQIKETKSINEEQADILNRIIDQNIDRIENMHKLYNIDPKSKVDIKEIAKNLKLDNNGSLYRSSEARADTHRKVFSGIFTTIAKETNVPRDDIEKEFYLTIKDTNVQAIQTAEDYKKFLESIPEYFKNMLLSLDDYSDVSEITDGNYRNAVSLLTLYNSMHLPLHTALFINNGELQLKDLNISDKFADLNNLFKSNLAKLTIIDNGNRVEGSKAISAIFTSYNRKFNDRWSNYKKSGPDNDSKYETRKEQYKADLNYLEKLTGIPGSMWESYFDGKTNETLAWVEDNGQMKEIDFETYYNLLKQEFDGKKYDRIFTKSSSTGKFYVRQQSKLVSTLNYTLSNTDTKDMFKTLDDYFTKGDPSKKVFSNIYKLSTSVVTSSDTDVNFRDIKDDHRTAFMLNNHLFTVANNIQDYSQKGNKVSEYYDQLSQSANLSLFNGFKDLDKNGFNPGDSPIDMNDDEFIISQLALFLNSDESYKSVINQFGDKDSIYLIDVPKLTFDEKGKKELLTQKEVSIENYNESVNYVKKIIAKNNKYFANKLGGKNFKESLNKIAENFVLNFISNVSDLNDIFHGKNYKNITDLIKRAGSTISPGYNLLNNFEYSHAVIKDPLYETLMGNVEEIDGITFINDDLSQMMQEGMGGVYSNEEEYPTLESVKAIHSNINLETGLRGLTKTNIINVESLARQFPNSQYAAIKKLMDNNKLQSLSFVSGTKKNEWDITNDAVISDTQNTKQPLIDSKAELKTFNRSSNDLYVQHDLRHSTTPSTSKQAIQMLTNILPLSNSESIVSAILKMQQESLDDFRNIFTDQATTLDIKTKWIKENLNEENYPEVMKILEKGGTIHEPSLAKLLRTILISEVSKQILEIPSNRIVAQSVPVMDIKLNGFHKIDNGRVMLPEVAMNIEGKNGQAGPRYAKFYNNKNDALEEAKKHSDLELWEIYKEGKVWVVPGEPVVITRVPASDLHSHTVARLKYKINEGNYIMMDRETRIRSGEDFDGDVRYINTYYRNNKNNIIDYKENETKKGLANKIIDKMVEDYKKEEFFDRINEPIDTDFFGKVDDKYDSSKDALNVIQAIINEFSDITNLEKHGFLTPIGLNYQRMKNLSGVKMKGILTDVSALYSFLSDSDNKVSDLIMPIINGKGEIIGNKKLNKIARDKYGVMKYALDTLLNLAFDNAKDPRIEILGLNEVTFPMFSLLLMSSDDIENIDGRDNQKAFIKQRVLEIARLMNQKPFRDYIQQIRNKVPSGEAMDYVSKNNKKSKYNSILESLINKSNDINTLTSYNRLLKKLPKSVSDLNKAKNIIWKVKNNKLNSISTNHMFSSSPAMKYLQQIEHIIDFVEKNIFDDTFELSTVGKDLFSYLTKTYKLDKQSKDEIYNALNHIGYIQSMNMNISFDRINTIATQGLERLREQYPGNAFLNAVQIVNYDKGAALEILSDYRRTPIPEDLMQKIKEDSEKIPESKKNYLAAYSIYKYGMSASTRNGNFYLLFDDTYKATLSQNATNTISDWMDNQVDPIDVYNSMRWILQASKNKNLSGLNSMSTYGDNIYDLSSVSDLDFRISRDGLSSLSTIESMDDISKMAVKYKFDPNFMNGSNLFKEYKKIHNDLDEVNLIKRFSAGILKREVKRTIQFKNKLAEIREGNIVKNQLANNSHGRPLLSDNPQLSEEIYAHMSKKYPGVKIFTSQEAFEDFVVKNGGIGLKVDPKSIGNAFKNAVRIDPNSAFQDTIVHEFAHIYWDSLPDDNASKKKLFELFDRPGEINPVSIEEEIIDAIGRSGTDMLAARFSGSMLNKVINALKNFWRDVKIHLKKIISSDLTKEDLIYSMAKNLITGKNLNRDWDNPVETKQVIKNMVRKDPEDKYNDDTGQIIEVGDRNFISPTRIINALHENEFNPIAYANKRLRETERKNRENHQGKFYELNEQEKTDLLNIYIAEAENKATNGTLVHAVSASVFNPEVTKKDDIKRFIDKAGKEKHDNLVKQFTDLKNKILEKYPNAKFDSEKEYMIENPNITGIVDLVVDIGDDKVVVFDLKSMSNEMFNEDMSLNEDIYNGGLKTYVAPLNNVFNTKKSNHTLQVNLYRTIIEKATNKKVVDGFIIPLKIEGNEDLSKINEVTVGKLEQIPFEKRDQVHIKKIIDYILFQQSENNGLSEQAKERAKLQGRDSHLIDQADKAVKYFQPKIASGELKDISNGHVESSLGIGFRNLLDDLGHLGFERKDVLSNKSDFTFEMLYYAARDQIKKSELLADINAKDSEKKYFTKQLESSELIRGINKNSDNKIKYMYRKFKGKDRYIYHGGLSDVKVGDKIIEYIDIDKGVVQERIGIVSKINKWDSSIGVKFDENDNNIIDIAIHKFTGALILKDKSKLTDSQIKQAETNGYEDKISYERNDVYGYHYKQHEVDMNKKKASGNVSSLNNIATYRRLWREFEKFNKLSDNSRLVNDYKKIMAIYNNLKLLGDVGEPLQEFVREVAVSHVIANTIKEEASNGINSLPLATLNLYLLATGSRENLWKDIDASFGLTTLLNPRMVAGHYVPFTMFTSVTEAGWVNNEQMAHAIHEKLKGLEGEVDTERIVSNLGSRKVFNRSMDFPKESPEYELLSFVEAIYAEMVPEHNLGRIPVPSEFMTKEEFQVEYGSRFGGRFYNMLKPEMYDNVKLEVTDREDPNKTYLMTLREIKDSYKAMLPDIKKDKKLRKDLIGGNFNTFISRTIFLHSTVKNASELIAYREEARKIYKGKSNVNNPNLESNTRSMRISGRHRQVFETSNLLGALEKNLKSISFRYNMQSAMPMEEYVKAKYGNNTEVYKWISDWTDTILYKNRQNRNEDIATLINGLMRRASLVYIAFKIKTQAKNLKIGMLSNLIYDPDAFFKARSRLHSIAKYKKAFNIIERYNLVNIVDYTLFDNVSKQSYFENPAGTINSFFKKVENAGYKPMDWAEKVIQVDLFIGNMTSEEWNAYDTDGSTIKGKEKFVLSEDRRQMLEGYVRGSQGDYAVINQAPFFFTSIGQLTGQFKKFIIPILRREFVHYNRNHILQWESGVFPTVFLMGKLLAYNVKSDEVKMNEYEALAKEESKQDPIESLSTKGTKAYYNHILKMIEGRKVTLKDLSKNDIVNLKSFTIQMLLLSAKVITMLTRADKDDDDRNRFAKMLINGIINTIQEDIYFWADPDTIKSIADQLFASMSIVSSTAVFIADIFGWMFGQPTAKYGPGQQYPRGTPKAAIHGLNIIPYGGAMKEALWAFNKISDKYTGEQKVVNDAKAMKEFRQAYNFASKYSMDENTANKMMIFNRYVNDVEQKNKQLEDANLWQNIEKEMERNPAFKEWYNNLMDYYAESKLMKDKADRTSESDIRKEASKIMSNGDKSTSDIVNKILEMQKKATYDIGNNNPDKKENK